MKYDKEKLNGINEENLGILWYDEERDEMIIMDSTVNPEEGTIEFNTDHFSEYIIVDIEEWQAAWDQRVVRVRNDADSFDISFVIDDSGSMTSNDPQDLRIEAVENFIEILRKQDNYSIIKFASSADTIKEITDEASEDWQDNFRSSGGTNITNGVSSGITTLSEEIPKSGMETVSVNYLFSVDKYNRTRALIIDSLKGDRSVAYEDATNADGTVDNSQIRIFYDIDCYLITTNDKPEAGSDDGRDRTFIIEYNGDYINFDDEPLSLN